MARHASLADQLAAYRRFVTEPDHDPEPVQTNWSVTPTNDNDPEEISDLHAERHWDISPSVDEIMRQVKRGPVVRNDRGLIVQIGTLRFSDGTQTESGFKLTVDGKVVAHQFPLPAGAMIGTTDKERAVRGGEDAADEAASNRYFGAPKKPDDPGGLFQAAFSKPRRRVGKAKRTGPQTKAEARQWLADAIANTPVMPAVTKCPDGFPAGPKRLAHLWPGLVKTATGDSGASGWEDIVSQRERRNEWHRWVDELKPVDRAVLEAARTAKTYADVGVAAGQTRQYADKKSGGRKALIAANDNLMSIINKMAS